MHTITKKRKRRHSGYRVTRGRTIIRAAPQKEERGKKPGKQDGHEDEEGCNNPGETEHFPWSMILTAVRGILSLFPRHHRRKVACSAATLTCVAGIRSSASRLGRESMNRSSLMYVYMHAMEGCEDRHHSCRARLNTGKVFLLFAGSPFPPHFSFLRHFWQTRLHAILAHGYLHHPSFFLFLSLPAGTRL